MKLRPYQTAALDGILNAWEAGTRRALLVLPTGTGKTIVFCRLAEELVRDGKRVLILAHRGELLDQAADKMIAATGLGCAVEKADKSCLTMPEILFRIVVGSVQTLMRPKRLAEFARDHFDAIIVDEAHHALADSYQRILNHFETANVLGVTATPDRGDLRNLGEYFEAIAYEYSMPMAIREEWLVPIQALTIPLDIDLAGVTSQAGDFKAADLGGALAPYLTRIAEEMATYCADRKTVVFLPLIATSQQMCALLNQQGLRACEVNGGSPDRKQILADFHDGKFDVLCNSMLLTEGWDEPAVDCIVCLRPTKIRSLYCQMVGRGTRLHPGKESLLLLDFLWHTERHALVRPAHLISESDEVADKMIQLAAESAGEILDLGETESAAEGSCTEEREEALASQLESMRKKKKKLVDPLQFEMSIMGTDLTNYVPAFGWEAAPATDSQKTAIEGAGIDPAAIATKGKAELMLQTIDHRRAEGLTTPKQIRLLERYGFRKTGTWQFHEARQIIDRIAANRWRPLQSINPKTYTPPKTGNPTI